jgi:hypothetical protein
MGLRGLLRSLFLSPRQRPSRGDPALDPALLDQPEERRPAPPSQDRPAHRHPCDADPARLDDAAPDAPDASSLPSDDMSPYDDFHSASGSSLD